MCAHGTYSIPVLDEKSKKDETEESINAKEWKEIYRALLENGVEPGLRTFRYNGREVPLRWEKRELGKIHASFGTLEEADEYIAAHNARKAFGRKKYLKTTNNDKRQAMTYCRLRARLQKRNQGLIELGNDDADEEEE